MAVVARVTTRNMGWVLTRCRHTIVTGAAAAYHLRMVDCIHRYEGTCVVTILTHSGGLNVRRVLASGVGTIVAIPTIINDIGMTEIRR